MLLKNKQTKKSFTPAVVLPAPCSVHSTNSLIPGVGVLPHISHLGMCPPSPPSPPPKKKVWFLRRFGLKTGIHFAHFGLESGMVYEGTTGVYEPILLFQFQMNTEKESCLVPGRLSSMCAQRKAGRRQRARFAVCTLPMVPCGSSPVTRVSRSPLPCEKRSA